MQFQHILVPEAGRRVRLAGDFSLDVPDHPIIPFIEGDGMGIDVTPAMRRVVAARRNVEEDLQRLIPGAKLMSTSGFASAVIRHMGE